MTTRPCCGATPAPRRPWNGCKPSASPGSWRRTDPTAGGGRSEFIPVPEVVVPVDTTAAGDSFNAAYIAARMSGQGPADAAAAAHRLAAQVIRHRGALMPRAAAAVH